jgi:hypothetical protein
MHTRLGYVCEEELLKRRAAKFLFAERARWALDFGRVAYYFSAGLIRDCSPPTTYDNAIITAFRKIHRPSRK